MGKFRGNIAKSWLRNTEAYMTDPAKYFDDINKFLYRYTPTHFRFHVGGDIPNVGYFSHLVVTTIRHPTTRFVVFTKKFSIINEMYKDLGNTNNLRVMLSAWPHENSTRLKEFFIAMTEARAHPFKMGVAWQEKDARIGMLDYKSQKCAGSCHVCKLCWDSDSDVILYKH
jgi:hypothetical protein